MSCSFSLRPKENEPKEMPFFEGVLAKTFKNCHKKQIDLQNFRVFEAFYGYTDEKGG
jgi:hypothetical protein